MNKKLAVIIGVGAVAFFAFLAYSTLGGARYRVTVCMAFEGRNACKTVKAKTETDAIRGAITNACADIASGVTQVVACEGAQPASITWLHKPQ